MIRMSYSPVYTSEIYTEAITRVDIGASSVPTTDQTLVWIEEIEKRVIEKALGSHTVSTQYINVAEETLTNSTDFKWFYETEDAQLKFTTAGVQGVVVPLVDVKMPIISVTHLYLNDNDPDETAVWTELTAGPAAGSSYMLLKTGNRDSGYALWFYDNEPDPGVARLKMDYTYGHNIDSKILRDYCTCGVAIKVLLARMGSNSASGLSMLEGDNLGNFVPIQYEQRIAQLRAEMLKIEIDHFPPHMGGSVPMSLV